MVCLHLVKSKFVKLLLDAGFYGRNLACILGRGLFTGSKVEGIKISGKYAICTLVNSEECLVIAATLGCRAALCGAVHTVVCVDRLVRTSTLVLRCFAYNLGLGRVVALGGVDKRGRTAGRALLVDAKLLYLYVTAGGKEIVAHKLLACRLVLLTLFCLLKSLLLVDGCLTLCLDAVNGLLCAFLDSDSRLTERACLLCVEEGCIYCDDCNEEHDNANLTEEHSHKIADGVSYKSAVRHIGVCLDRGEGRLGVKAVNRVVYA